MNATAAAAMTASHDGESPWRLFTLALQRDRLAMASLIVLVALTACGIFGKITTEWWVVFDPATVRLTDKFRPPFSTASQELAAADHPALGVYLMGTDELGRDVFARMLQGSYVSISIGFVAVAIALVVGVLVGGIAGYFGPRRFGPISPDSVLMRFTDAMMCIPTLFLILVVVALLPASIYNIMIVIGLTRWMTTARLVRAEFLSLRERDFIVAARALGLSPARIIARHMLPNALAPVLVTATIGVAGAILTESALSFLGLGVQPPFATWGNILADGKRFIFDAPWLFFIPGFAIFIIVLAFNLAGEGMREALNPRGRQA